MAGKTGGTRRGTNTARLRDQPVAEPWRNRIVEYGTLTTEELQANPLNPRIHDDPQRRAIRGALDSIGWVAPIIVNRLSGLIVDGHMRVAEAAARGPVPVAFVELTDDEEAEVMATFDPIGAMADYNPDTLRELTEGLDLDDDVAASLAGLLPEPFNDSAEAPTTIELKPLQHAHVLVSVPLDRWDDVAPILGMLDDIDGITVASTLN